MFVGQVLSPASFTDLLCVWCVMQRNILEDPSRGYLENDTIIIKYTIELVVSSGGALSRNQHPNRAELIKPPLPTLGKDLGDLFSSGEGGVDCADIVALLFLIALHLWWKLSFV